MEGYFIGIDVGGTNVKPVSYTHLTSLYPAV